jgi:hypothetical protein
MKLRNLPEFLHARSKTVFDEYERHKLLAKEGKLRVSAATAEELAKLLRKVLEAESATRAVDTATDLLHIPRMYARTIVEHYARILWA